MPKLHFLACLQLSQKARSMEDKGLVVSRFQGIARAGGGGVGLEGLGVMGLC